MKCNSCDELAVLNALVDHFYGGAEAFHNGKTEADMPVGLCDDEQHYWLCGFRNAAHRAENPCISVDEYEKVAAAAHRAGCEDRAKDITRPNPFCPEQDSERNDIWGAVYSDGRGTSGFEDFEVLGTPRQVIDVD